MHIYRSLHSTRQKKKRGDRILIIYTLAKHASTQTASSPAVGTRANSDTHAGKLVNTQRFVLTSSAQTTQPLDQPRCSPGRTRFITAPGHIQPTAQANGCVSPTPSTKAFVRALYSFFNQSFKIRESNKCSPVKRRETGREFIPGAALQQCCQTDNYLIFIFTVIWMLRFYRVNYFK